MVKNLPANAGNMDWIPGLGRFPGEGNDNPLQYSCLGNPMDRRVWQATVMGSQRVRYGLATEQQTNQTVNTHRMLKRTSVAVGNACQLDLETVETNNRGLLLFIVETIGLIGASQVPLVVKNPPCQCRKHKRKARSLGKEDPLEKGMATHSSILAWRIPWNLAGYSPLGHTV